MTTRREVKLGKLEPKYDPRTIVMGALLQPEAEPPHRYDYSRGKAKFPFGMWGNDAYGDCECVSEACGLVRMERRETRHTISITADAVIAKYKERTGCVDPGDANDTGLYVLDSMRDWRNTGWQVGDHTYKIAAFGSLRVRDHTELRRAIWLLGGIYTGFALPVYVRDLAVRGEKVWNAYGDGPDSEPGSWGGHAMFCDRYDENGLYLKTWATTVYATNSFIDKYMDEAWAVVDDLDNPHHSRYLDVSALTAILKGIATQTE